MIRVHIAWYARIFVFTYMSHWLYAAFAVTTKSAIGDGHFVALCTFSASILLNIYNVDVCL